MNPRVTLDQWRAFLAVVEQDGFGPAAEALHLSQSTVSYAVSRLQDILGIRLLRVEGRKAVVTAAGEALLPHIRQLLADAVRLEQRAAGLGRGWEAQVRLVTDILAPPELVIDALQRFRNALPPEGQGSQVILREEVLTGSEEAILDGRTTLGLHSQVPPGCRGESLLEVTFHPVSAPTHELQQLERPLEPADLRRVPQVFIRDTGLRADEDDLVSSPQRWTVGSRETAISMVRHGLGFCWAPGPWIRDDLAAGRLRLLPLQVAENRVVPLYLVYPPTMVVEGPAARLLADSLRAAAASFRRQWAAGTSAERPSSADA